MKWIIALLILSVACVQAQWRIINGTNAVQHEYPSIVSIKMEGEHFCGGTLISGNTVLTAGHCVWDLRKLTLRWLKYYKVEIVLGEHDQESKSGKEISFPVTEVRYHPSYDMDTTFNKGFDVAVIKFDGYVSRDDYPYVTYTKYPLYPIAKPDQKCTVVGWGSMLPPGEDTARFLQKADLYILSTEQCGRYFRHVPNVPTNICAGAGPISKSACRGDSGGPLFCIDEDNRRVQVGVVSYGRVPCGRAGVPSVFTRLSEVSSWITKNRYN